MGNLVQLQGVVFLGTVCIIFAELTVIIAEMGIAILERVILLVLLTVKIQHLRLQENFTSVWTGKIMTWTD